MNIFFGILGLAFILIWVMSLYLAITQPFKNKNAQILWILILFFIPLTSLIFIFSLDYFIDNNKEYEDKNKRNIEEYNRLKERHQRLIYATWELRTSSKDLAYAVIKVLQNIPNDLIKDKMLELANNHKENMDFLDNTGDNKWSISTRMDFVKCIENVNIGEVAPEPYKFDFKDDETYYFVMYLVDIELVKG